MQFLKPYNKMQILCLKDTLNFPFWQIYVLISGKFFFFFLS